MKYYGDIKLGKTITWLFTATDSTGAVATITNPSVKVYENADAVEITAGASIANFDSNTGLYLISIVATTANGFESGKDYTVVLDGTSAIGSVTIADYVVGAFSIENRNGTYGYPDMPIGEATNISDMIVQIWSRFFKKVVKDKTDKEIRVVDTNGTILSNQNYYEGATEDYVDEIGTGSNT